MTTAICFFSSTFIKPFIKPLCIIVAFCVCAIGSSWAGQNLPFKGSASGEVVERVVIEDAASSSIVQIKTAAVGTFSHAGKSTVQFAYTERRSVSGDGLQATAAGTFLLIAADGSKLAGIFTSAGNAGESAEGEYQLTIHITSGTKRFAGARGTSTGTMKVGDETSFSFQFAGSISMSPGNNPGNGDGNGNGNGNGDGDGEEASNDIIQLSVTHVGDGIRIDGRGLAGRIYLLQYSNKLSPQQWIDLSLVFGDATGGFTHTDVAPVDVDERYYRAVLPLAE